MSMEREWSFVFLRPCIYILVYELYICACVFVCVFECLSDTVLMRHRSMPVVERGMGMDRTFYKLPVSEWNDWAVGLHYPSS